MNKLSFEPYRGREFPKTGLLILGMSTYRWHDGKKLCTPSRTHPTDSVAWSIANFGRVRFFTQMNRALCGCAEPTVAQMRKAWNKCAYTVYVQEPVGVGAKSKTKGKHFRDSESRFRSMLEDLRPRKIVVTGKGLWENMPSTLRGLDAYELKDGSLVWCLPVEHPSDRRKGFNWMKVAKKIRAFGRRKLALKLGGRNSGRH